MVPNKKLHSAFHFARSCYLLGSKIDIIDMPAPKNFNCVTGTSCCTFISSMAVWFVSQSDGLMIIFNRSASWFVVSLTQHFSGLAPEPREAVAPRRIAGVAPAPVRWYRVAPPAPAVVAPPPDGGFAAASWNATWNCINNRVCQHDNTMDIRYFGHDLDTILPISNWAKNVTYDCVGIWPCCDLGQQPSPCNYRVKLNIPKKVLRVTHT